MIRTLSAAWAVPVCVVVSGAVAEPPPVFTDLAYEDARAKAASTGRLFVLDATAGWCAPCKRMDRTTWVDERVVRWLGEHAIAAQVDVDDHPTIAGELRINALPTIIAFRGEEEVDRIVGYRDADALIDWLSLVREGRSVLDALRGDVERAEPGPPLVDARYALAEQLVSSGELAQAGEEYAWLWENIPELHPAMGSVRVSFMASEMEHLASREAAARARFEALRDRAEERLRTPERTWDDLRDWIVLNGVVADAQRTLAWVDRVKETEEGLESLRRYFHLLDDLLLEHERWADYGLIVADPVAQVRSSHVRIGQIVSLLGDRFRGEELDRMRELQTASFRREVARLHASLLAAGREREAWETLSLAMELDEDPALGEAVAQAVLDAGVARARHMELPGARALSAKLREAIRDG